MQLLQTKEMHMLILDDLLTFIGLVITVNSLLSPPGGLLISSILKGAYWREGL